MGCDLISRSITDGCTSLPVASADPEARVVAWSLDTNTPWLSYDSIRSLGPDVGIKIPCRQRYFHRIFISTPDPSATRGFLDFSIGVSSKGLGEFPASQPSQIANSLQYLGPKGVDYPMFSIIMVSKYHMASISKPKSVSSTCLLFLLLLEIMVSCGCAWSLLLVNLVKIDIY